MGTYAHQPMTCGASPAWYRLYHKITKRRCASLSESFSMERLVPAQTSPEQRQLKTPHVCLARPLIPSPGPRNQTSRKLSLDDLAGLPHRRPQEDQSADLCAFRSETFRNVASEIKWHARQVSGLGLLHAVSSLSSCWSAGGLPLGLFPIETRWSHVPRTWSLRIN